MTELDKKWESGELGRDEKYAKKSTFTNAKNIDDMLGLQPISIRLQKSLLQDLKDIAQLNDIGYQPLIKQILTRFVEAEKRMIANEKIKADLQNKKTKKQKIA
ncbi:hypothetical protein KRX11_07285 [Pasteurellaceae bacterium TAE3-ERU1]|nr:hypothetical protein [Pasteurellaceae bacterium TAE3-ERU1]